MTVVALDINEQEAGFSNYGNCVDIWAPGVSILSTKLGGGTQVLSGTPMASPHVAGAAALFLALNPTATPAQVEKAIKDRLCKRALRAKMDGQSTRLMWVAFSIVVGAAQRCVRSSLGHMQTMCVLCTVEDVSLCKVGRIDVDRRPPCRLACTLSRRDAGVAMDSERSALNLFLKASKAIYATGEPLDCSPCSW